MGDDKGNNKKPPKEKKPHPFRNGLIIGAIFGGFLGLLIDTPTFMSPIKDPIAGVFQDKVNEGKQVVGESLEKGGKAMTDTGKGIKQSDAGEPKK